MTESCIFSKYPLFKGQRFEAIKTLRTAEVYYAWKVPNDDYLYVL